MMGNEMVLQPDVYFAASVVLFGVSLLLSIILWVKLRKMKKRYKQLINGDTALNVEEIIIGLQTRMNELSEQSKEVAKKMDTVVQEVRLRKSRVEMIRYNAFAQGGSDMSFSIAIVNDEKDGLVITGIHNREETYIYAKPLEKGLSKYNLSSEEKQVIDLAAAKPTK